MTRNRELSQLGKYVQVDENANQINFAGGSVSASSFIGDGSGLSAITGTGSGIVIRDGGTLVGTAATINFGDNLTVSPISSGIVTVTGSAGGGGILSRTVVTAVTGTIGSGTALNITIPGYKAYALLKVGITSAAWLTIYTDTNSRISDASRSSATDPNPGSGVIAEVLTTTSGSSTFIMTPGIIGWNNDVTPSTNIYAKIVNNESAAANITVTLTLVQLES
jgi:hypothetical protein